MNIDLKINLLIILAISIFVFQGVIYNDLMLQESYGNELLVKSYNNINSGSYDNAVSFNAVNYDLASIKSGQEDLFALVISQSQSGSFSPTSQFEINDSARNQVVFSPINCNLNGGDTTCVFNGEYVIMGVTDSGSMRPTIEDNSQLFCRKSFVVEELHGKIIVYNPIDDGVINTSRFVVHRCIYWDEEGEYCIEKGDNVITNPGSLGKVYPKQIYCVVDWVTRAV